jgi:hypothetical protein
VLEISPSLDLQTLKMNTLLSFQTSENTNSASRGLFPENPNPHQSYCENPKSRTTRYQNLSSYKLNICGSVHRA